MKDPVLARRITILLTLAAYAATSAYLNSIRATAELPLLWTLIVLQFGALLTFGFCCYYRIRLQYKALPWLIPIGLALSRVNNWELLVLPAMAALALAVKLRTPVSNEEMEDAEDLFSERFESFSRSDKEAAELESAVSAQPGSALLIESYLGCLEKTENLARELRATASRIPAHNYLRSTVDKAMSVVADALFARSSSAGDVANECIAHALSAQIDTLQAAAKVGAGSDGLPSAMQELEELEKLGQLALKRAQRMHELATDLDSH